MKNFLTIASVFLLTFFSFNSFATTYYLSSSSGSDNNSGTDASSPWRSIDKLNSFYNLRSGDNVLFKRGDTFYGGIQVNNSGSSGNPITYGAYGSGAKPIITGFTNITSWNNLGSNIWESSDAVSSLSYTNMVSVNGINTPMGRYPNTTGPNTGYLYIQSHSGNSSLTASGGLGSNNWTGAGIVIRKEKYVIERGKITSQSGSTLYYNGASQYNTQDDFGFFVQNDPKTLDVNGEWYYNPSTNKLRIYSSSRPSDVRIATVENLVSSSSKSNITFDNITFTGSNSDAISCLNSGNNLTVQNCDITLTGMSAIWTVIQNSIIQNNNISDVNYIGVYSSADNAVIKNNSFNNINLFEGADQIIASGGVISTYGQNTVVQYNQINNCGYSGIKLGGLNTRVSNNLVNRFCLIKEDGGGIDMSARDRARGSVIDGNIVLNGIGSSNGTSDINSHDFGGIFIDAYGTGVTITNNSVANVATAGIKLHGSNNIIIKNNTTFNNGGSSWTKGGIMLLSVDAYPIYNLTIEGNIFVARNPDQLAFFGYPAMQSFGTSNNNYFAKPIDESTAIKAYSNVYNLAGWKSYSGEDGSSKGSPKTISNVNDLRFEYNATSSSKTIQLDANYIDVKYNSYNGSITLAPYTSAVLIRNGDRSGNNPPTADAGSDRIIQLPSNSVVLPGSGSDADGSVVSYSWSQVSGPSTATMVNPSSAQAGAGNLIEGAYVFQLTVTDNQGATGTSKVTITVKSTESLSGSNVPPMAIVGDDRTIQLPKKSVVLPGSGSDADGSVVSYSWSQVSGPSTATLVNTSSAQGGAGDLVEGVYQFQLQVTDNQGATGTSVLKVTVESGTSGSNIKPIANVGDDRVIDFPKKSIVLPGSGSDADGSVVSYSWSQVSGPSTATLINTSSAQAGASNLVVGVYQFQLQVTDNQGATGTAVLKVTVNSENPNVPPVANVGTNRQIYLPKNSIVLPGSGSDADGSVVSYSWSQVSGPSNAIMVNPSSAQAGAGDLNEGKYVFQLTVTDDQGATGTANLEVTVNSNNPNIPPVASVGTNRQIDLPKNSIVLPGSGSDIDGSVVSYAWSEMSGPSTATMVNPSSAEAGAGNLKEGTYVFQLTVTDDQGATGTANLTVVVNSGSPNIPPVANVGTNRQIDLPKNSIVLPGSGSDADGSIVSYSWSQVSGPSTATMVNPSSAQSGAGDLKAGNYQFQLTVTDNQGATGSATLIVTVNSGTTQARIANLSDSSTTKLQATSLASTETTPQPESEMGASFKNSLKIYPNPAEDFVNVEIYSTNNSSKETLIILDMSGRIVYRNEFTSSAYNYKKQIDISRLKKGNYIISVNFNGSDIQTSKLIKL
ncbi:MAG: T9SS type A sorting domain-containing protein [Ginsengibacter sp.]